MKKKTREYLSANTAAVKVLEYLFGQTFNDF